MDSVSGQALFALTTFSHHALALTRSIWSRDVMVEPRARGSAHLEEVEVVGLWLVVTWVRGLLLGYLRGLLLGELLVLREDVHVGDTPFVRLTTH